MDSDIHAILENQEKAITIYNSIFCHSVDDADDDVIAELCKKK